MASASSSSSSHQPPPREEWSDLDFDLPEGHSIIQHLDTLDDHSAGQQQQRRASVSLSHKPSRPTNLRMSTGPEEAEDDDDGDDNIEDWDAELELGIGAQSVIAPPSQPVSLSLPTAPIVGTVNRLGAPLSRKSIVVEDWDMDMDLDNGIISVDKPLAPIVRPSTMIAAPDWDGSDEDDDENGNVSTIKLSRLPTFPPKPTSVTTTTATPAVRLATPTDDNEDDLEDAFALPSDLSHLSLRPLAHRESNATIEWTSSDTASFTSDAPSSFGFGGKATSESPVSLPGSEFNTTDEEDEEEEHDVEGLVLPDAFLPKDLLRMLESKKKGQAASSAAPSKPAKIVFPNAEDDFENGLVLDDDDILSSSRLRQVGNGMHKPRQKTSSTSSTSSSRIPAPSVRPPSRITITRASTLPCTLR